MTLNDKIGNTNLNRATTFSTLILRSLCHFFDSGLDITCNATICESQFCEDILLQAQDRNNSIFIKAWYCLLCDLKTLILPFVLQRRFLINV